jgi:hypothetical protein
MLDGLDGFPVRALVIVSLPVLHELVAGKWMLSLGHPDELFRTDGVGETESFRKLALPFPRNFLPTAPITLIGRSKLAGVI